MGVEWTPSRLCPSDFEVCDVETGEPTKGTRTMKGVRGQGGGGRGLVAGGSREGCAESGKRRTGWPASPAPSPTGLGPTALTSPLPEQSSSWEELGEVARLVDKEADGLPWPPLLAGPPRISLGRLSGRRR